MAKSAEAFFGEVAAEREAEPKAAAKSAEQFFADVAEGKEKPSAAYTQKTAAKAPSMLERGASFEKKAREAVSDWYSWSPATAAAELGASAVTGVVGGVEGLIRGGIDLVRGEGVDAASDTVRDTLSARTYAPRSKAAQALGSGVKAVEEGVFQPIAAPIEEAIGPTASKAVGAFGEATLAAAPVAAAARVATLPRSIPRRPGAAPAPTPDQPPSMPIQGPAGPALETMPARTAEVLEMPQRPSAPKAPAPGEPTVPARAPGTVEMPPQEFVKPKPLEAKGGPRERPYTELEGDEPPQFVEDTPAVEGGRQLPKDHQLRRAQILREIGIEEPRTSALTGDTKAAATDFQASKLDNQGGDALKSAFDAERGALEGYAGRLVTETRGTPGLGQTEILQRGQNILAPLDDLKSYFDDGIRALYRAADEQAGGVPTKLIDTKKLMTTNKSFFTGTTDGQALYQGTAARMRELGIIDENGRLGGVTVQQAEQLKQYLNEQWTPSNSRLIRKLKDSIDDDVTRSAGTDIYEKARALRAARGRILDDPKGISRIMDAEGPEGINRSVPVEKISDTITTMPVAQFEHIVNTLKGVPDEIQPTAQAAINEIKAQFASKIFEIGSRQATQWNAKGVSQYLNANSARMKAVFTPEELQRFATLNDAGHILRFPSSYPGAAVQAANLVKAGVGEGIESGFTTAGAGMGGIFGPLGSTIGAVAGRKVGSTVGGMVDSRRSLKAAQKRFSKISDLLDVGEKKK